VQPKGQDMATERINEVIYELTDEQIERITTRSSKKAVEEYVKDHACRFTDRQASRVCAFDRACEEHSVTEGDLFVMVYSAKTAHGFFKDLGKRIFYTTAIAIILLLAWMFGSEFVHKLLSGGK
jgi:hypothetical protein